MGDWLRAYRGDMTRNGIDTSHWNHPGGAGIDWEKVRADGYDWAAIKITEGTTFVDPYGEADCMAAMAAGLEVVPYHFARPLSSGAQAEAQFFEEHIPMAAQNCKRMLDLEDGRQLGWGPLEVWTHEFLVTKRTDFLYVNRSYLAGLKSTGETLLVSIVMADPDNKGDHHNIGAWQRGQGQVAGIVGIVDLDDVYYDAPQVAALPELPPGGDGGPSTVPVDGPPGELTAGLPNLFAGAAGGTVAALQRLLEDRGARIVVDGAFGSATTEAVQQFQSSHGLLVDGVVGPATWAKLLGD